MWKRESNGKLEGDRNVVRFQQTNLGRLIATAHMERAKADFAVMNSGGVRDSIEAGDITYKDVLTVQPFGNMVSYIDMSGKEVLDYLNVVATKPIDSGAYAQFAGLSMTVENGKVYNVFIGGTASPRWPIPLYRTSYNASVVMVTRKWILIRVTLTRALRMQKYWKEFWNHSPIDVTEYAPSGDIAK